MTAGIREISITFVTDAIAPRTQVAARSAPRLHNLFDLTKKTLNNYGKNQRSGHRKHRKMQRV